MNSPNGSCSPALNPGIRRCLVENEKSKMQLRYN